MQKNKLRNWVNREVKKNLFDEPFSSLPLKMRLGIFILLGSFVIGYGLPPLIIMIAGKNNKLAAGIVGGAFFYIISWVLGIIGLFLAGRDSLKYPIHFFARVTKKLFPVYFDRSRGDDWISLFSVINIVSVLLLFIFIMLSLFRFSKYWIIGIGSVATAHQILYIYGMFSSRSNYFFKSIKGKEFFNNEDGVLFRFDDGPDPVYTPRILDILKENSIKAFFAITGKNAEKYLEIVKRIHREDHIIGNHTYSHPYNILFFGYKKIFNEISRTNEVLKKITGETPEFFCPPLGQTNPIIGRALKDLGLKPIMWDIRTGDTHFSAKKIVRSAKKKITSSSIVLFHDGILAWSKKDREDTVEALKIMIKMVQP